MKDLKKVGRTSSNTGSLQIRVLYPIAQRVHQYSTSPLATDFRPSLIRRGTLKGFCFKCFREAKQNIRPWRTAELGETVFAECHEGYNIFARSARTLETRDFLLRSRCLPLFHQEGLPFSQLPSMSSTELKDIIDAGNDL